MFSTSYLKSLGRINKALDITFTKIVNRYNWTSVYFLV